MSGEVIVVVENDTDILEYMEVLLRWRDYQPIGLLTAAGALALIRQAQPALVILDLQLEQPDSGLTLLQQLRTDTGTTAIPVIMYSADEHMLQFYRHELQALDCSMLPKPFLPDDLFKLMKPILDTRPGTALPYTTDDGSIFHPTQ